MWPILGIIVLPFTTLINALVWTPGVGRTGLDWLWVLLALLLDHGGWASSGYANRDRYVRRRA